ncbi:urease accessory protein UreD [Plantactinospora sp. WMMB334]|uniref:urease accessory protein UreD n=1 Tax=Plantactinospora sp. WMMB334 TaxID=3404119 RepID=UPI003B92F3FB
MRAEARIVVEADPARGTRLAVLRGDPPLLLRRTGHPGPDGELHLHLVGGAAGPLGGDDLRLDIEVGPGARLCVRSVAASLALPGPAGGRSRLAVTARVGSGGSLRWLPEPLIGAAGCDHVTTSRIELAEGAELRWREELVCGRHAESPGDVRITTSVRYAGRTLLRSDVAIGPRASGWSGPAVLDGAGAAGTLLLVDPPGAHTATAHTATAGAATAGPVSPEAAGVPGVAAAVLPLAGGPAVLISAVGTDPRAVRRHLDRLSGPTGGPGASAGRRKPVTNREACRTEPQLA